MVSNIVNPIRNFMGGKKEERKRGKKKELQEYPYKNQMIENYTLNK